LVQEAVGIAVRGSGKLQQWLNAALLSCLHLLDRKPIGLSPIRTLPQAVRILFEDADPVEPSIRDEQCIEATLPSVIEALALHPPQNLRYRFATMGIIALYVLEN